MTKEAQREYGSPKANTTPPRQKKFYAMEKGVRGEGIVRYADHKPLPTMEKLQKSTNSLAA